MDFQMQSKRVFDNSNMFPDFSVQMPNQKRRMQHENQVGFGPITTIDMNVIEQKIFEVEQLLNELYALRAYFEQKNKSTNDVPSYFT